MILFATWGLMLIIPALSVIGEMLLAPGADLLALIGKWFVFWGVGVRLLMAGVHQIVWPAFTSETIFNIKDPAAQKLVTEIGFGNVEIGTIGTLSLWFSDWLLPAAVAGALFLGLAGIKHVLNQNRTSDENRAMITDLILGIILAAYVVGRMLTA